MMILTKQVVWNLDTNLFQLIATKVHKSRGFWKAITKDMFVTQILEHGVKYTWSLAVNKVEKTKTKLGLD